MSSASIRQAIEQAVAAVAPEADLSEIDLNENLREALEIDSFDFLNVLIELNKSLGVEVPESDYAKVNTLAEMQSYLQRRSSGRSVQSP